MKTYANIYCLNLKLMKIEYEIFTWVLCVFPPRYGRPRGIVVTIVRAFQIIRTFNSDIGFCVGVFLS